MRCLSVLRWNWMAVWPLVSWKYFLYDFACRLRYQAILFFEPEIVSSANLWSCYDPKMKLTSRSLCFASFDWECSDAVCVFPAELLSACKLGGTAFTGSGLSFSFTTLCWLRVFSVSRSSCICCKALRCAWSSDWIIAPCHHSKPGISNKTHLLFHCFISLHLCCQLQCCFLIFLIFARCIITTGNVRIAVVLFGWDFSGYITSWWCLVILFRFLYWIQAKV